MIVDTLPTKIGWLVLSTIYTSGREEWEFHEHRPNYVGETYDARTNTLIDAKVKRIMYAELDE